MRMPGPWLEPQPPTRRKRARQAARKPPPASVRLPRARPVRGTPWSQRHSLRLESFLIPLAELAIEIQIDGRGRVLLVRGCRGDRGLVRPRRGGGQRIVPRLRGDSDALVQKLGREIRSIRPSDRVELGMQDKGTEIGSVVKWLEDRAVEIASKVHLALDTIAETQPDEIGRA